MALVQQRRLRSGCKVGNDTVLSALPTATTQLGALGTLLDRALRLRLLGLGHLRLLRFLLILGLLNALLDLAARSRQFK